MSQIDTRALIGQLRYEAEGEDALSMLCGCAADEIERLRAALKYIADNPVCDEVADYARATIEQPATPSIMDVESDVAD